MKVLIETDDERIHKELKADNRGRINLGSGYAGKRVSIAVVEVENAE